MFGGMKNKLQEMQQKMEETKARLETISVEAKSHDEKVIVTASASRKIKNIQLHEDIRHLEVNEISKIIMNVTNEALEKAENVAESEMKGVASGMLPGFPGL